MLDLFSVAVVFIRAGALLIIANTMSAIPPMWGGIREATYSPPFTISIILVGALSQLLLALLLLIFAKKLARFITKGLVDTSIQITETNTSHLQAVAFSTLGAYVLLYSIPRLIELILIIVLPDNKQSDYRQPMTVPVEFIVEQVVRVAFGLWLLLGSKGIAILIKNFWMTRISADSAE
ncbi:MAG: hypothetical protein HY231_20875 [Acidobacteria bacterium]|nr:hypothetical protein [Acidobacteriota bacterium]